METAQTTSVPGDVVDAAVRDAGTEGQGKARQTGAVTHYLDDTLVSDARNL